MADAYVSDADREKIYENALRRDIAALDPTRPTYKAVKEIIERQIRRLREAGLDPRLHKNMVNHAHAYLEGWTPKPFPSAPLPVKSFPTIVPASFVDFDYNDLNIGNIKVYRTGELTTIVRTELYININPTSMNTYVDIVGRKVSIQYLVNSGVFNTKGVVIEIHPQLALYMSIYHDEVSNYRPLLTTSFGPNYDSEFVKTFGDLCKYEKLQLKMMYYILCHYVYIYILKTGMYADCNFNESTWIYNMNKGNYNLQNENQARIFFECEPSKQIGIAMLILEKNDITLKQLLATDAIKSMKDSVFKIHRESAFGRGVNSLKTLCGSSLGLNDKQIIEIFNKYEISNPFSFKFKKPIRKTRRTNLKKRNTMRKRRY